MQRIIDIGPNGPLVDILQYMPLEEVRPMVNIRYYRTFAGMLKLRNDVNYKTFKHICISGCPEVVRLLLKDARTEFPAKYPNLDIAIPELDTDQGYLRHRKRGNNA